ncbi:hypothetical protein [Nannocystis sp.]|uniref:hypothetical protein n=1 Tax=Nannocystis sp. TaxID=1962667 RepID=UPI0025ED4243|nr:hypothetical protein [Nannocystis sp.]MBK7827307.1 hypothetical protein [Nannocystis sp.]
MPRTLAPLLAALLVTACYEPQTPQPAPTTATKPAPAPLPPPQLTPPAPGADDPRCGAAVVYLNAVRTATELSALRSAYTKTALQALVQASDAATKREDDVAITTLLAATDPTAPVAVQSAIHGALAQWMRHNLKLAVDDKDRNKRAAAWAAARCVWAQDLRQLGLALQQRSNELSSETARDDATAVDIIDAAFTVGNVALAADPIDERALLPAHQTIEKTWYRVVHRELGAAATRARDNKDPLAARHALGLFDMLRDRLQDKNTPGIAIVAAHLAGDPTAIDPAAVLREVDVALAKRTRKYCSDALTAKLLGTPAGIASAQEGASYARVLLPGMRARLADQKFDADAHVASWTAFVEAVDAGVDEVEIKRLSDDLVHWNCAYQQALGVRECTATADEPAKPAALTPASKPAPARPTPGSSPRG